MFIIRFNFFRNDFGFSGNPKVRTELLYIRLSWIFRSSTFYKFSEFNLAPKKDVEGSFLFWLN